MTFAELNCPKCGDRVDTVSTEDGNRLGLCGHVWKDGPLLKPHQSPSRPAAHTREMADEGGKP